MEEYISLNLITCEDKIIITSILQIYVLNWYNMYLLYPGIDRTQKTIFQHLYWSGIREAFQKKATNCGTCQGKKQKKNGKLPSKESEQIPFNKLCVYITSTYIIRTKGQKENLN